jgi:hypothetical protein
MVLKCPDPLEGFVMAGQASLLIYRRGKTVVKGIRTLLGVDKDGDGKDDRKISHAGVGTLTVGGTVFDTIERLDGYVFLDPGRTYLCRMEISPNHKGRRQIRPVGHGKQSEGSRRRGMAEAAILIHPGAYPYHFEGCIGVGEATQSGLKNSKKKLDDLFALCGGFEVGKEVMLSVEGNPPDWRAKG